MNESTTSPSPTELRRSGTEGELATVCERLLAAGSCLGRVRRLGALLDGNVQMLVLGRCATLTARERAELRADELSDAISRLLAEAHAHIGAATPHVERARRAARVDQFLADQVRLERVPEDARVEGVA